MALIRLDHVPETTKVNLPLYMILPDPGQIGSLPVKDRKLLYLLHGLSDDASAWQRYTAIETIAAAYGLIVVMPSVNRSFYTDQPNGQAYFSYLVEELPHYLALVFGLTPRREDTLIAGVSMGGYGAFKAALLHPELYHAAASFSGVLSVDVLQSTAQDARQVEFTHLFGDLERLGGSQYDPAVWLKNAAKDRKALPRLFIACGRQDNLYPLNRSFYQASRTVRVPVDFHEEDGRHDWFFWDKQIRRFLAAVLDRRSPK
ncbi:MAG: alpha/beta hydrolase family protein [Anaerolineaceae bacterium]|nr:alpha/beta hydrolase family protein [Anaerolineaceae bacterium]